MFFFVVILLRKVAVINLKNITFDKAAVCNVIGVNGERIWRPWIPFHHDKSPKGQDVFDKVKAEGGHPVQSLIRSPPCPQRLLVIKPLDTEDRHPHKRVKGQSGFSLAIKSRWKHTQQLIPPTSHWGFIRHQNTEPHKHTHLPTLENKLIYQGRRGLFKVIYCRDSDNLKATFNRE